MKTSGTHLKAAGADFLRSVANTLHEQAALDRALGR